MQEKVFSANDKNIFSSFVEGAASGLKTGVTIFPYILGMLVAISLFRNSGIFDMVAHGLTTIFTLFHMRGDIINALPVALLRPFSSGGSRGFMIDAMQTYGPDSFTGRLSSVFQCSAETTFYVIAVYFGSIKVKNTRYTLSTMLLLDLGVYSGGGVYVFAVFLGNLLEKVSHASVPGEDGRAAPTSIMLCVCQQVYAL